MAEGSAYTRRSQLWAEAAEQCAKDRGKSAFFLRVLLMSSLSGSTVAGIKLVLKGHKKHELRESLLSLRDELQTVHRSVGSSEAPAARIREVLALLVSV